MKTANTFSLQHTFVKPLTRAVLIAIAATAGMSYADDDSKTETQKPDAVVRIDPTLERLAAQQTSLPVIIVFGEQPQRKIARTNLARCG